MTSPSCFDPLAFETVFGKVAIPRELLISEKYFVHIGDEVLEFGDMEVAFAAAASAFCAKGRTCVRGELKGPCAEVHVEAVMETLPDEGCSKGDVFRLVVTTKKR